jgi:hypothetical protein
LGRYDPDEQSGNRGYGSDSLKEKTPEIAAHIRILTGAIRVRRQKRREKKHSE